MKAVSVDDYRALAQKRLPHFLFEYIDGGSYSQTTLGRNISDIQDIALKQRILRDVSTLDTRCTLFGETYDLPVALAPIGLAGMNAKRGEVQAVRAANTTNIPFTLSTVSVCPISEVKAAAVKPFWFQLYVIKDRAFMRDLIAQAAEANCSALVFTVDMPVPGARYRDYHSGLAGAPGMLGSMRRAFQASLRPRWALDVGLMGRPHHLGNVAPVLQGNTGLDDFFAWMRTNFDPSISWKDMAFIRSLWKGPLIIKGIMDPEDAREAAKVGADGIIVSNHGGRQLDGVPSSARALPAIADAVKGDITLMADGGIRSGLDVVKMLALGADSVMLGRAWAYALAAGGEQAITHMLSIIEAEMRIAMALTGTTKISDITRGILV